MCLPGSMTGDDRDEFQRRWDHLGGPIVRVEQDVPAPPAEVCAAWLDPQRLATWWWPQWPDTTYEIDARTGGRFRIHSDRAQLGAHGEYLHLGPEDEPEILMTWNWDNEGPSAAEELVRVRFESRDGVGTTVVMEHKLADPDLDVENPTQGWTDVMARLA